MSRAYTGPIEVIALRDSSTLEIWPDRVVANGHAYIITQLTGAASTSVSAAGRRPAQPALSLRGPDGAWTVYVPADPPDVERALQAIYRLRPDLATAAATRPPGSGLSRAAVGPDGVSREQALLACIAHLSIFFAPFVVPLLIWLALQPTAPYAAHQAKQALAFHLATAVLAAAVTAGVVVVFLGSLVGSAALGDVRIALPALIGLPVVIIVAVAMAVFILGYSVYAAVQTLHGRPFHYPLLGWL